MKRLCIIVLLLFYALAVSAQNPISVANIRYPNAHTVSEFSTDQDDLELPADYFHYRLSASTTVNVTGIVAMDDGIEIMLSNAGDNPITLKHENDSSTAENRFSFPGEADLILNKGQRLKLFYDALMSRWTTYGTGVGIGGLAPPADSPLNLMVAVTGTATADISWLQGGGDFAILLLSESPIADLPVDGVLYSANPEFGSGSNLGNDVFAVAIEADRGESTPPTTVTVSITGLTEATQYFVVVVNYNLSGAVALYNRSISADNSTTFTTNASESTPTVPYTITRIETKEDSVIIYGIAGNGDARAVLMAENKEVDAFFEDDQSYSADDFGKGDQVGTGNYVVFNDATESPIKLAGFERDKLYSNPYIAEYSANKYLLPPPNGPPEFPNLLRTAWFYDETFASGAESAGQTYLEANARVFYDFTKLTGTDGSSLSNGNDGLVDQTGNGHTATIVGTPTVEDLDIGTHTGTKSLGVTSDEVITTNHDGSTWFNSSFRVTMAFWIADGQPASGNHYLFGVQSSSSTHMFYAFLASSTNNEINIRYRTPTADSRWDSNNTALLADGPGFYVLEIQYNFTDDQITVLLNGSPVTGDFISGSMAALNPSDFDPDVNFTIGSANLGGTIQSNATAMQISRFAVTGITSSQQAADIREYFNFIPSGAGTGFDRWTVHETQGFTYSVSNDSLILSGQPLGYEDYLITKDIIPDTLGEFRVSQIITINADPASGDSGIGLGLINDLSSEANRGVIGLFYIDPDNAGQFGRVHLYSGNGAVSATDFTFRAQSSGAFVPAKDSSYVMTLERDIQGNDVLYSFTLMDLYDSTEHTISWLESNRVSDTYYGSTMRPMIYMNGGSFRVKDFSLRRTGSEFGGEGEPEPPPPFDADLVVSKSGSDANNCEPATPCLTLNRTFQVAATMSPTVVDVSVGPGVFIESTFLNPPSNLGTVRGAGKGITTITGNSNLYTSTSAGSYDNMNRFLINYIRGSSTTVNTTWESMTFDGNSTPLVFGQHTNGIKGAFAIQRVHGLTINDCEFKNFHISAIRVGDSDEFTLTNSLFENNSRTTLDGGYTMYQLELWNVGGGTPATPGTGFTVRIDNNTFRDLRDAGGQAIGFKGGPGANQLPEGNEKYITNIEISNNTFDQSAVSMTQFGHRFDIEGLFMSPGNMYIHDNYFTNNISFGMAGLDKTLGKTRIYNNTFNLSRPGLSFTIEMQISNVEIDHNYIFGSVGTRNGAFVILNTQETFSNEGHAPLVRLDHGEWHIHHNIIECGQSSYGDGIIGALRWDVKGLIFEHNTVSFKTSAGGPWYGVITSPTAGHSMTGLVIRNNAYHGQASGSSVMYGGGGTISGGIVEYNKSTHFPITATKSGVTSNNNQIHPGSNGLGLTFGTKPTTQAEAFGSSSYWRPAPGSVLIGAGHDGSTIGALEPLEPN